MDAEKMLEEQRKAVLKFVDDRTFSPVSRLVAFEQHVGKLQAVWFLGLLTNERYDELLTEWKQHDPLSN